MIDQLIINTEYFLQCAGSCSGCFLSEAERNSQNNFHDVIKPGLIKVLANKKGKDLLVIGFGRGNNLNLTKESLIQMGELISYIEKNHNSKKLVFEVSTSLIGKINTQIENAILLLQYSKNIYFNVVVNSEITSQQFWKNLKTFHTALTKEREKWGWSDNTGDILVLNINPAILPDIAMLEDFSQGIESPINISLFPFDEAVKNITGVQLDALKEWTQKVAVLFKFKDLNIKNHLEKFNFELSSINDVKAHNDLTKSSYFFIDKSGDITEGIPSIMGEVDFPRLLTKYKIQPDIGKAFKIMQRHSACINCDYQNQCLATGAYLNMLANHKRIKDKSFCPSGYKEFFHEFLLT